MGYTYHLMRQVKIVSLNIQHGWNSDGAMPVIFRRADLMANLNKIADLLKQHKPDIVLLQEVDRISPITRRIDQLNYIAERVGYLHHAHGASSEMRLGKRIVYAAGCGIMSRFPITATENIKFDQSFLMPRKGFLVATLAIGDLKKLTVVSAHLPVIDILNIGSKRVQVERMVETLRDRGPVVIGGDLNMSLSLLNRKNIGVLASRLNVESRSAVVDSQSATYPAWDPRRKIDWIFASPELAISDYTVISERVSDHLAIGTTITV